MKKILLIIFSFVVHCSYSQVPHYWIESAGGTALDEGLDISVDANNNTYTTGYFSGTATFNTTTVSSNGVFDIFISKTDTGGNYIWVQKAGGSNVDEGLSIKADSIGNVYVTGFFSGSATFGATTINSAGLQDMFVAKYNTNGVLQPAVAELKMISGTELRLTETEM